MPIKIHHGPPGSFKTSGAMGDDFLREAKAGRVIVTNVRGVSRERVLEEFPDLPETFDVIHVDDKSSEGRQKWATWFHWMPHGAFIFIDEVQDIWPKSWREANIRALDYPGGVDQATKDDRPKDWEQALDKHRHYNWDMTLTTPSYSKVRDDVKSIADMAYKHKDLALLGWSGRYIEGAHAADDSGKNASDFVNVQRKKVPPYVFKLYDSTATGVHSTTKSGFNLFKNPRIAFLLVVLVGSLLFGLSKPLPKVLGGTGGVDAASAGRPVAAGKGAPSSSGAVGGDSLSPVSFNFDGRVEPFLEGEPFIIVSYKSGNVWRYSVRHNGADFTNTDLLDMGYTVKTGGACAVTLIKDKFQRVIVCGVPEAKDQAKPVQASAGSQDPGRSIAIDHRQVTRPFT